MSIRSIFTIVKGFLFSRANREFMLFMFFFALSGVFWLIMTLNETYEYELRIPVEYTNVPKNIVLTSGENDSVRVGVTDKGIVLATYLYGHQLTPIRVDFMKCMQGNGQGHVSQNDLKKMVLSKLSASTKVGMVKPERLTVYYNTGEKKRVPVAYSGKVLPSEFYYMSDVAYSPDSITVFAAPDKFDSISVAYTEMLDLTDVHDTLTVHAKLRPIAGVKMVPDQVDITFATDILTEVSIDNVPIVGINMPEGKMLRTFPAKVKVTFVTGVSRYRHLRPEDFEVVADYNEMERNASSKCRIKLTRIPDGLTRVKLEAQQVEYLIEE